MLTLMILFNHYFILTQLTIVFLEIFLLLVSVTSFFPGSFSNYCLGTVPDTWLGPSKHLLNAESGIIFPLFNQPSIVFFKGFYFSKYLLNVYLLYFPSFACCFSHVYFFIQIHSFNCYLYSDSDDSLTAFRDTGDSYL